MFALAISAMMYFFYGIAQFRYKMAAHENIAAQKELNTIKISLKDFNARAGNDEIWYAGKLYDISSYTIEGDYATIVIFHDQQEESLVKNIINNFEPYDKYISDNTPHIVKHRIHPPDDNKILVSTQTLLSARHTKAQYSLSYFIKYTTPVYSSVIKPPPDMA